MVVYLIACALSTSSIDNSDSISCATTEVASEQVCHLLIGAQRRLMDEHYQQRPNDGYTPRRPSYRCVSVQTK